MKLVVRERVGLNRILVIPLSARFSLEGRGGLTELEHPKSRSPTTNVNQNTPYKRNFQFDPSKSWESAI